MVWQSKPVFLRMEKRPLFFAGVRPGSEREGYSRPFRKADREGPGKDSRKLPEEETESRQHRTESRPFTGGEYSCGGLI